MTTVQLDTSLHGEVMTQEEIQAIVTIAQRAPLKNMQEALGVYKLLEKLVAHFQPKPNAEPSS